MVDVKQLRTELGEQCKVCRLVYSLEFACVEHVIENRSETAQSHKHRGFYFHFGPQQGFTARGLKSNNP